MVVSLKNKGHECEDGSIGCFVTLVVKGGPAEMNNIEVGKYKKNIFFSFQFFLVVKKN